MSPAARGGRGTAFAELGRAGERPAPAYLVRGEDPSLVADAVRHLVAGLVGDRDPAVVVEDHGGVDEPDPGVLVDALTTAPFLVDRRVVVVRDAGRLGAEAAARLGACLEVPVDGVVLVLAGGGGTVPAGLVKTVGRVGSVVDANAGTGRARTEWLTDRLHAAPVRLDARAGALLAEHLGGDLGRLPGLLDTLVATYGEGAAVGVDEVAPFLGEAGSVAPWDLTDAVDGGDEAAALAALARLTGPGAMHPLAVLAVLHRHYETMLRLDGAPVRSPEEAAAYVGARSVFPVKKAMEQGRRLGSARLGRAVVLLADADLDLRGRSALPAAVVLEVLVARLSRLGGRRGPRRR